MTLRARSLLAAAGLAGSLALLPLLAQPEVALALSMAAVAAALAVRSVAFPLALAGVPSIVIALLGSNPFPDRFVAVAVFGWTGFAVAVAFARDRGLPLAPLADPAVLGSLLLAAWMLLRLGASDAEGYGTVKLQLFVTVNVLVLVAGIVVGSRRRSFDLFAALSLGVAAAAALVLVREIAAGSAEAVFDARFALDPESNPIQLGRGAAFGLLVGVYLILAAPAGWLRLAALAVVPPVAVALVASGSRGPVVGLLAGLLVLALLQRGAAERRRLVLVAVAAVAGAALVSRLVPGETAGRALSALVGGGTDSENGRYELWAQAWEALREAPLAGIGTGGFAALGDVLFPHNLLLEAAVELGLVGLALVLVVLVSGALTAISAWRAARAAARPPLALALALLTAAFVNAMFSGDIQTNSDLWLALGLGVGLARAAAGGAAEARPARRLLRRRADAAPARPARERSPGAIVEPVAGDRLYGRVEVLLLPAETGWGVMRVSVEAAAPDGPWREVAVAEDEAVDLVVAREGGAEHVAVVRSRPLAEIVRAALAPVFEHVDVVPAQRRPWRPGSVRTATLDTTALADGPLRLRGVTVDAAGARVATPELPVEVANAGAPAREPLAERVAAAARERDEAAAAVEAERRRLEERERELSARAEELEARSAGLEARDRELDGRQRALESELAAVVEEERRFLELQESIVDRSAAEVASERARLEERRRRVDEEQAAIAAERRLLEDGRAALARDREAIGRRAAEHAELVRRVETRLGELERASRGLEERARALATAETERRRQLRDAARRTADALAQAGRRLAQREQAVTERERILRAELEQVLAEQERLRDVQERIVDESVAEVAAEKHRLDVRERELTERARKLEEARVRNETAAGLLAAERDRVDAMARELAEVQSSLDEQASLQAQREAELARRSGELDEQTRAVEERERALRTEREGVLDDARRRRADEEQAAIAVERRRLEDERATLARDREAAGRRAAEHAELARRVEARMGELERASHELDERARALESAEAQAGRREEELEAARRAADELGAASAVLRRAEEELAEREAALEQRVAAVTQRELAVARAAARDRALATEPAAAPEPPRAPEPVAAQPPPAPPAPPAPARPGLVPGLDTLERLTAERPAADAFVQEEREATLFLLRDYAATDGTIPAEFEGLVLELFGDLLDR